MSSRRVRNILRKEWAVIFKDLNNVLFVTLLPLLIVAEPLVIIWAVARFGGESLISSPLVQSAVIKLTGEIPLAASLPPDQQFQILLVSQFKFFLMLIPTMIAVGFATFSIIEEKQSRSLEPLLATPVRTWELLLGKALSGAIPALIVTWLCALIFFLGVVILGWGNLVSLVLTPSWYITFFVLTPGVAILSFLMGVIGSSRAKDAKNAQNVNRFNRSSGPCSNRHSGNRSALVHALSNPPALYRGISRRLPCAQGSGKTLPARIDSH